MAEAAANNVPAVPADDDDDGDDVFRAFRRVLLPMEHEELPILASFHDGPRRAAEMAAVRATVVMVVCHAQSAAPVLPEVVYDSIASFVGEAWMFELDAVARIHAARDEISTIDNHNNLAKFEPSLDVVLREMDQYPYSAAVQREALACALQVLDRAVVAFAIAGSCLSRWSVGENATVLTLREVRHRGQRANQFLGDDEEIPGMVALLSSANPFWAVKEYNTETAARLEQFVNVLTLYQERLPNLVEFLLSQVLLSHGVRQMAPHTGLMEHGVRSRQLQRFRDVVHFVDIFRQQPAAVDRCTAYTWSRFLQSPPGVLSFVSTDFGVVSWEFCCRTMMEGIAHLSEIVFRVDAAFSDDDESEDEE